jgi:hypothetical protein
MLMTEANGVFFSFINCLGICCKIILHHGFSYHLVHLTQKYIFQRNICATAKYGNEMIKYKQSRNVCKLKCWRGSSVRKPVHKYRQYQQQKVPTAAHAFNQIQISIKQNKIIGNGREERPEKLLGMDID